MKAVNTSSQPTKVSLTFVGVIGDHETVKVIGEGPRDRDSLAFKINVRSAPLYKRHAAAGQQLAESRRHLIQIGVPD